MPGERLEDEESKVRSHLFGTDGIRGVVGELYTPAFAADIAWALATRLGGGGMVLIGRDYRTTSPGIAQILAGSLQMCGFDAVDMGPMPTPCFQFNVREIGARAGLMVTASHNPVDFNGIKFTGPEGLEIPPAEEREIERIYHARQFSAPQWERAGTIRKDEFGIDRFLGSIHRHVRRTVIAERSLKVVLDPGNGASCVTGPRLVRELGCRVTTLNAQPDGSFPGRPSEPSNENLVDLRKTVVEIRADLGIGHDGDADRIGFIDEKGAYVPGEVALALFARYRLRQHPKATIVTSVTSSSCIDEVVATEGGRLVVTKSGSLPVAVGIQQEHGVFGGEENGHYYWPEHQNAPDGPMSCAVMLELLAVEGKPLSAMVASLPHFELDKRKVPAPRSLAPGIVEFARKALEPEATRVVTLDGVKAYLKNGWILVRPSGTEPLIRVFAESRDSGTARQLADRGVALVHEALAESAPA